MASGRRLDHVQLNRILLRRQLLLVSGADDPLAVVTHLCGLNAQYPDSPYFGLSARVPGFRIADLEAAVDAGLVSRATLMRGTLHLVTAEDLRWLRPMLQSALERTLRGFFPQDSRNVDTAAVAERTRRTLDGATANRTDLAAALADVLPAARGGFLAHAARTYAMLAHEPAASLFRGTPSPRYHWLGPVPDTSDEQARQWQRQLVQRYLAAFGPATVHDIQYWSGLTGLRHAVADLADELDRFEGPDGATLWDVPNPTGQDGDVPAVLLLPDYDNILFAHADRTRIVSDDVRRRVVVVAKRMQRIVLCDGFVSGTWSLRPGPYAERATIVIDLPGRVTPRQRRALEAETARIAQLLALRGTEIEGYTLAELP